MAETTKKLTITCIHCGGMFTITIGVWSGNSTTGHQHSGSGGCGKSTQVETRAGNIVRTRK